MSDQYQYHVEGAGLITLIYHGERTEDNRARFHWSIADEKTGKGIGVGHDLNSGVSMTPTAREMLPSLLGFLGACGEARRDGSPESDNWNLFPEPVAVWAGEHADALTIAEVDVEEELRAEKYRLELAGLVDSFEFERCEICDQDVHRHIFAPDPLGNPHSYCIEEGARLVVGEAAPMR